ncbi:MAG: alpha/beta hydrolase [Gallicola sp.]|nr:alpha/beta hydrolase [Gallicola sp.]
MCARKSKKKILEKAGCGIVGGMALLFSSVVYRRQKTKNRMKIHTENGIQKQYYVMIGGKLQYVQIRGRDRRNPVILFLHGGPGIPHLFLSHPYQKDLEDEFTFVNWDQPSSGRTYYMNKRRFRWEKTTYDEVMRDVNELVDFLRKELNQEKIILIGHSWGSILGTHYAQLFPEKVLAYIGLGQLVDPREEEEEVKKAMELARVKANGRYLKELERLYDDFEEAKSIGEVDFRKLLRIRKIVAIYLQEEEVQGGLDMLWKGLSSPDMDFYELKWYLKVLFDVEDFACLQKNLLNHLFFEFDLWERPMNYQVPVYFIAGTSDWVTPYVAVEAYLKEVEAPDKALCYIRNAGHNAHIDNPVEFAYVLGDLARRGANFEKENR